MPIAGVSNALIVFGSALGPFPFGFVIRAQYSYASIVVIRDVVASHIRLAHTNQTGMMAARLLCEAY